MDYKKITVIPQITIYQNILKDCDNIINFLKKDYDAGSAFSSWGNWYHQGQIKTSQFNKLHLNVNNQDSELLKEEKNILNNIKEVYDFVKNELNAEPTIFKENWRKLNAFVSWIFVK
jgi:hypothetical protein